MIRRQPRCLEVDDHDGFHRGPPGCGLAGAARGKSATYRILGKRFALNNLCLGIAGSYQRCSACHAGYGWSDGDFDFTAEDLVDCLVCHDTTGTYVKFPIGAGHPPYEDTPFRGDLFRAPDLVEVAQHVGPTSRATCGACHFEGGGGDAVKHGDLDGSLSAPTRALDVHMPPDGRNFQCSTCHEFSGHVQEGSRYQVTAKPMSGIAVPGRDSDRLACESCHGTAPHRPGVHDKLNEHVEVTACQTCHIPTMARGGRPTKTPWDWSTAGRRDDAGRPIVEERDGLVVYDGMKGDLRWAENLRPEYRWFNGTMRYTLLGDAIDPDATVAINRPEGDATDPGARIWPFKIIDGRQPYDTRHQTLLVARLFGPDETAYWRGYDWDKALHAGMAEARRVGQSDATYSGEFGFVDTRMYWPVSHMVAPAEDAIRCGACHRRHGLLDDLVTGYVPGRDRHPLIESIGWWAVALTFLAVAGHGLARYLAYRRRSAQESTG
ncbi:tetrathionate reductase family octaheme c-type cytochrome [Thioalkalicoccus limnaeus]|uniref:Tetrathionate reductase family octaheme c-type cytochrome n=1 Tax=Thioalkalicoccus limnaeus TaxID=120681 RepID=A0ABV4BAJ5_9GAMM